MPRIRIGFAHDKSREINLNERQSLKNETAGGYSRQDMSSSGDDLIATAWSSSACLHSSIIFMLVFRKSDDNYRGPNPSRQVARSNPLLAESQRCLTRTATGNGRPVLDTATYRRFESYRGTLSARC